MQRLSAALAKIRQSMSRSGSPADGESSWRPSRKLTTAALVTLGTAAIVVAAVMLTGGDSETTADAPRVRRTKVLGSTSVKPPVPTTTPSSTLSPPVSVSTTTRPRPKSTPRSTRRVPTRSSIRRGSPPRVGAPVPQINLGPVTRTTSVTRAQLPETSDPFILAVDGAYYLYGSDNDRRAPITKLVDLDADYSLGEKNSLTTEGMPTKPAWTAESNQLWAPSVDKVGTRWVMWYSADRINPPDGENKQCIGRALASSPEGPFTPDDAPVYCGENDHGALDPSVFTDPAGRKWLLVAIGNTETPLVTFLLDANGDFPRGARPIPLLGRTYPWQYHFLENPSMVFDPASNQYLLAYSAGRWNEARYSTGIARCATPFGPCVSDPTGPWLSSLAGRTGTGGLSFFTDLTGTQRVVFASFREGGETKVGGRSATVMKFLSAPSLALLP